MLLAMIGILVADDLLEARKNNPAPVTPAGEDAARTAAADRELSARLRVVSEKIKAVAKQIESL